MSIEAMKQALEAYLSNEMPAGTIISDPKWWAAKIANVASQAIEEESSATQEPVAVLFEDGSIVKFADLEFVPEKSGQRVQMLYTHPQPKAELTPEWLWCELMDWCKKRMTNPADYNDLFSIVTKMREKNETAQPKAEHHCKGIPRKGCNYLAGCDSPCNKCGEIHHHHQMVARLTFPEQEPKREPLTDEKIEEIRIEQEFNQWGISEGAFKYVARAIEAAHGIKE